MKCFTLFSIILLTGTAVAQQQTTPPPPVQGWVQLTSGVTAGLSHISLVGPDTVYISGDTLLRSTDAGATWEGLVGAPAGSGVLDFRDDTTGFLVSNGIVYKTINGGITWANVGGGYDGTIQFIGQDTGWTFNEGYLARSTDGGNTWKSLGDPGLGNVYCMTFSDALHGIMMGEAVGYPPYTGGGAARLQTSSDGGLTWSGAEYAEPTVDHQGKHHSGISEDVLSLTALSSDTVIAVGGQIGRSTDGGVDWDAIGYPASSLLQSVCFIDKYHGTAVGSSDVIVHTSDGGLTWSLQNSGIADGTYLYGVKFIDSLTGYVVGEDGIILKTVNGGLSWVNIAPLRSNQIQGTIYPQPSSSNTSIAYNLPEPQHVRLFVQNITGATVLSVLTGNPQSGGIQTVPINTEPLTSGTYTYVLQTEKYYAAGKIEVIH